MANIWWWWWRWGRVRVPGKTMLPSLLLKEREREADDSVRWVGGGKKRRKVFLLLRLLLSHLSLFLPSFSPPSTTSIWKQQRGSNTGRPRKKSFIWRKEKKEKTAVACPKIAMCRFSAFVLFPPPGHISAIDRTFGMLSLSLSPCYSRQLFSFFPSLHLPREKRGRKQGREADG